MNNSKVLFYILKLTMKLTPSYISKTIISSVFKALIPFLNIIIIKYIIDELMGGQNSESLVKYVIVLVGGNFILRIVNKYFEVLLNISIRKVYNNFDAYVGAKCVEMDFENIENVEILDLKEKAFFAIYNLDAIGRILTHISNMVYSVFVIVGLSYLLISLSPLLIIGMLLIVGANTLIFRHIKKLEFKMNQTSVSGNRAYGYYINLTTDFSIAKDIRVYQGSEMIVRRIKHFTDNLLRLYEPAYTKLGKFTGFTKVNIQLQMVLIYLYLAFGVMSKSISLGEFTMYAGAVSSFSITLSAMIESIIAINMNCDHLELFIHFDKLESNVEKGARSTSELKNLDIEFKSVTFNYPNKQEKVLKDINIIIKPGEKLSVVGLNGAGKTTFIKLLARLYEPTAGVILIGGRNINTFIYEEYIELLGIVFQDFKLLSYSIDENISGGQDSKVNVLSSLGKAGFHKDLEKLKHGTDTCVYKNFDKEGIEFSGGQSQKIALARALYKDSPIVILDEPTSALDPISEYEVYKSFNAMVKGKTAIYISHRLSSTRFSDNIVVFDSGEIVEYGTHDDLIKANCLYAKMYETQSQYYI